MEVNTGSRDYTKEAAIAADALSLDFRELPFTLDDLARGIRVEYEHGKINPITNITNDDLVATAKIALAHLLERHAGVMRYDYYDGLEVLEHAPAGYWRARANTYWPQKRIAILLCILLVVIAFSNIFCASFREFAEISFAEVAIIGIYLFATW